MLKVNSDYTCLHSKKDTIKIISRFKSKLRTYLESDYNLLDIDAKYIIGLNEIHTKERTICFNNSKENTIYQFNPYINNHLMDMLNNYDFPVNTGVISYSAIFHRDYTFNLATAPYEYVMYVYLKEYIAEINDERVKKIAVEINYKINAIISQLNINLMSLPEHIHFTTVDQLHKEFFLLPANDVISHANNKYELMFVFGVNGNNSKNIAYIEDKFSAYGNLTGSLYVYSPINNQTIRLMTISIAPSKNELKQKIVANNLNVQDFWYALETLNDDANTIGIEIYFDQLMMFIMQKYSIHEIVASPLELNVTKKFSKLHLL